MTAPTLRLSDLAGPDASGYADVAVFVRADGSESEPFVVLDDRAKGCVGIETTNFCGMKDGYQAVRRLGRGRLVPTRIEMQGEAGADLAAHVRVLREALAFYADPDTYHAIGIFADPPCGEFSDDFDADHHDAPIFRPGKRARAALAATAPKPPEARP